MGSIARPIPPERCEGNYKTQAKGLWRDRDHRFIALCIGTLPQQYQQLGESQCFIMQSSPMPLVRSACESCHKRKQKCVIPDGGGSCDACRQASRTCYFLPRVRAGRPRRLPSASHSGAGIDFAQHHHLVTSPELVHSPSTEVNNGPFSPLSHQAASFDGYSHSSSNDSETCKSPNGYVTSLDTDASLDDFAMAASSNVQYFEPFPIQDAGYPNMAMSALPWSSSSLHMSNGDTDFQDDQFEAFYNTMVQANVNATTDPIPGLAQSFVELRSHRVALKKASLSSHHTMHDPLTLIQPAVNAVDAVCSQFAAEMDSSSDQSDDDDAGSSSMFLTSVVEAFSVCEAINSLLNDSWSHRLVGPNSSATMPLILELKRLDFSMAQAMVCVVRLLRQHQMRGFSWLVNQGKSVQKQIGETVERAYRTGLWG